MHSTAHLHCAILAGLACGVGASAQSCMWTDHAAPSPGGPYAVIYHAALGQVVALSLGTSNVQVWGWTGTDWQNLELLGPPQRPGASAVYDSARQRIVLVGGGSLPYTGGTWEWDHTWFWTAYEGASPPAHESVSLAYDPLRQRTVLFCGSSWSTVYDDTWEWDGVQWTQVDPGGAGPSGRTNGLMVFDSVRGRTVLYGGRLANFTTVTDLWEWDGATWTARSSALPENVGGLAFDPTREMLIAGRYADDLGRWQTWEMDSQTAVWTQRDPSSGFSGIGAYHPGRASIVLTNREYHPAATMHKPYFVRHPNGVGTVPSGSTVQFSAEATGSGTLAYQWRRNGHTLMDGPNIAGATTPNLTVSNVSHLEQGNYDVVATNACGPAVSNPAAMTIEGQTGCYPNCDESLSEPRLNVADFTCFLQRFAAGHSYANCDSSYAAPPLNIADFTCFMQRFAAGCP